MDYYDRYWLGKTIKKNSFDHTPKWTKENINVHLKFFDKYFNEPCLDYGCGIGVFSHCFTKYIGVDTSKVVIKEAKRINPNKLFSCELPFHVRRKFNTVLSNIKCKCTLYWWT